MNNSISIDRRQNFQHAPSKLQLCVVRGVDKFHTHDEGAAKLLSDNRARYFAQSKATRGGLVPLADAGREYERQEMLDAREPDIF